MFDSFDRYLTEAASSVTFRLSKDADLAAIEVFDPLTVLKHLIEAEIPIPHALRLWEEIIRKLVVFNPIGRMTESQLHGLISQFIGQHEVAEAAEWVTRYHNIFGESQDEAGEAPQQERSAHVLRIRSAQLVRRHLRIFIAREFGIDESRCDELIDGRELAETTNALMRVVRFAGLQHARPETLDALIDDLAHYSQKSFIPALPGEPEQLERLAEMASTSFLSAFRLSDVNVASARNELNICLELLARVFLLACRIPPYCARQQSFARLAELLQMVASMGRGCSGTEAVARLVQGLARSVANVNVLARHLTEAAGLLKSAALSKERLQPDHFVRLDDAFNRLLAVARELSGFSIGIGNIARALRSDDARRSAEVEAALTDFAVNELGLTAKPLACGTLRGVLVEDLGRIRMHAECLRWGRNVAFYLGIGGGMQGLAGRDVQACINEILALPDTIGILVVDREPPAEMREYFRNFSQPSTQRLMIWGDTYALSRIFSRRDDFLPQLGALIAKALGAHGAEARTAARKQAKAQPVPAREPPAAAIARKSPVSQPQSASHADPELFICYAHTDLRWIEELKVHLKPYVRAHGMTIWDDSRIAAGDDWRDEIRRSLVRVRSAILLVSPQFLNSDFVTTEELPTLLSRAQQDGLRVFWIPVSASAYKASPIECFQAAHDPQQPLDGLSRARRNVALVDICRKIYEEAIGARR